jgi:hypothetical protein
VHDLTQCPVVLQRDQLGDVDHYVLDVLPRLDRLVAASQRLAHVETVDWGA